MTGYDWPSPVDDPEAFVETVPFPVEPDIVQDQGCRVERDDLGFWTCTHGVGREETWEQAIAVCLAHEEMEER